MFGVSNTGGGGGGRITLSVGDVTVEEPFFLLR